MLLRLDTVTHTISMLSLPPDLAVTIHCPTWSGIAPYTDKINAAYARCGPSGSLLTVSAVTGLPINYLVTVNFRGFKKVVNTLGGVWVGIDRRYFNNQVGPSGYAAINLQPGYQKLSGGAALDFVRYRHSDDDMHRIARQQLFVQAMKEQLKQSFDLQKALAIIQAAADNVGVGIGGGHHVDLGFVLGWGRFIYDLPVGHLFQPKIEGLAGQSGLTTDPSNIQAAVQQFTNPRIQQINQANAAALAGLDQPKQTVPKPSATTIVVLNGTVVNGQGVAHLAAKTKHLLAQRSYHTLDPPAGQIADAPPLPSGQPYFHAKVYYNKPSVPAKAAARMVAELLAPAEVAPLPPSLRSLSNGAMLTAVVGTAFANHPSLALAPAHPTIKRQTTNVVYNPSATESLLRNAQPHLNFPLMVPTVIESSSVPDKLGGDQPVRIYNITNTHKAVYLIFRRGGVNEYWGIEETDWKQAPVLNEKNFHRLIGGRSYDLHYHSQHLHMIVLHNGKTDYWVFNTLVDSLPNQTMVAIAQGLKPLKTR